MKQLFFSLALFFFVSGLLAQEVIVSDKNTQNSDEQLSEIQPVIKNFDGLAENCSNFSNINCGNIVSSTTTGGINDFSSYTGVVAGTAFNGQDRLFRLTVQSKTNLHIVLESAPGVNLDLLLLNTCSPANVVFASTEDNSLTGLREVIDVNSDVGILYIMVESKSSAVQGNFKLSINCTCDCAEPIAAQPNGDKIWGDDFKEYQNGKLAPQSTRWQLWSATAQDAAVTQEGTNKIAFFNGTSTVQPDVIYHTSNRTAGRFRMSWRMKINSGKQGYYNVLHGLPNSSGLNAVFAYEVYFLGTGQGEVKMNSNGNVVVAKFAYPSNEWINVVNIIDIEKDVAELWIGDNFVHSWRFSISSPANSPVNKTLAGIDFYANNNNAFYIDNLCIWQKKASCITTLELFPVCTDKGEQYGNSGSARCDLYTIGEYGSCTDICDFGGTFIDRGVTYSGKLEAGEDAPANLKRTASSCNALTTNAGLFADIYTFINDQKKSNGQPEEITINYNSTDPTLRCNIFTCQDPFTGAALSDPRCLGSVNSGQSFTINQSGYKPDIFYYIVFSGALGATYNNFSIIPNGYCPSGAQTLSTNGTTVGSIGSGTGNARFTRTGDAYKSCYNGTRSYSGAEKIYQFTLEFPAKLSFELSSASEMSMFLYSYICGGTCLDYGETKGSTNGGIFIDLGAGTYYLVVDKNGTASAANFSIKVSTNIFIVNTTFCNSAGNPEAHTVTIPLTAYPFVQEDNLVFVYESNDSKLKETMVQPLQGALAPLAFEMTASASPTPKCGYDINETFKVFLSQQKGSNRTFKQMNLAFTPRNVAGNTAEDRFEKTKRSTLERMTQNTVAHFGTETTTTSLQSGASTARLRFSTNKKWKTNILENPGDETPVTTSWLTVTPNAANGAAVVTFSAPANPSAISRTLNVQFYAEEQPYLMRHTIQVTQFGKNSGKSGGNSVTERAAVQIAEMQVSPNPTNGHAIVQLDIPQTSIVEIRLLDMTGRSIAILQEPETMEGNQIFELDLDQYPSGLYRIAAMVNGQPLHRMLSLQR